MADASSGTSETLWKRLAAKPFALWVIFGGLVYFGLGFLAIILPFLISNPRLIAEPFVLTFLLFLALFLGIGAASLTGKRWVLAAAAVVSVFFLLFYGSFIVPTLANPADPFFWLAISGIPALLLVAIFSILSLVHAKRGVASKKYLATPQSLGGLLAIAVVGFVIGGVVVGNIAATSIRGILGGGCSAADIRIVSGAMAGPAGGVPEPFSPATFTVSLANGGKVTWCNGDTTQHTVTSNTTGQFDSGLLNPGDTWPHTFTQPGTYLYYCTPHSTTMWGKVVVTP